MKKNAIDEKIFDLFDAVKKDSFLVPENEKRIILFLEKSKSTLSLAFKVAILESLKKIIAQNLKDYLTCMESEKIYIYSESKILLKNRNIATIYNFIEDVLYYHDIYHFIHFENNK